tara:strand:- start:12671 stop:13678 length:1008 start_codon:yes stop_codon:yes gene_type:complete
MRDLNKLLINKINIKNKNNFALIIGLTPSKGARSPALWNSAYKFFKKKTKMFPADVEESNLGKLCNYLKSNKYFLGSSVTVPYKEKIMKYLDHIDKNAKSIGSINTIVNKNGKLFGLNTDYLGSIYTLKKMKIKKSKKKILIFGCGGAGKACIVSVINYFKNSEIQIFNRSNIKLKNFIKIVKIKNNNSIKIFSNLKNLNRINKLDCIINCTSIGFDGWFYKNGYFNLKNFSPISQVNVSKVNKKNHQNFIYKNKKKIQKNLNDTINFLANFNFVTIFDIIYQPLKTNLMIAGELFGHKTINGLQMNFMQAVEAFGIVNNLKKKDKIAEGMRNGK